jgi:hypothetical protein
MICSIDFADFHQAVWKRRLSNIVWYQQAGMRATTVKRVCALHFSLVLSEVYPERSAAESNGCTQKKER